MGIAASNSELISADFFKSYTKYKFFLEIQEFLPVYNLKKA